MAKLRDIIKRIFRPKPKQPLTPEQKQAIDEQVVIIDTITRGQ